MLYVIQLDGLQLLDLLLRQVFARKNLLQIFRVDSWLLFQNLPGTVWVLIAFVRMVVIFPLFMLCNAQPRHHLPVVLPHDYQYILVVISGAISGGYILSRSTYITARYYAYMQIARQYQLIFFFSLVKPEELKDAYHVQMLLIGVETGILSFLSIVAVDLL